MENKKCVILSQEDYDDLYSRANANYIKITCDDYFFNAANKTITIYCKFIDFSVIGSLRNRISSVEKLMSKRITEFWNDQMKYVENSKAEFYKTENDVKYKEHISTCKQIANMGFFERRKFLKEFKNGK